MVSALEGIALRAIDAVMSQAMQIHPPNALFVDPDSAVQRARAFWSRNRPGAVIDRVVTDMVQRTLVTALNNEEVRGMLDDIVQHMTRRTLLALTGDLAKETR